MNIFKTNHSIYKLLKTSLSLSIYKYCIHNVFSSFIYSNLLLNYKSPCKYAWHGMSRLVFRKEISMGASYLWKNTAALDISAVCHRIFNSPDNHWGRCVWNELLLRKKSIMTFKEEEVEEYRLFMRNLPQKIQISKDNQRCSPSHRLQQYNGKRSHQRKET